MTSCVFLVVFSIKYWLFPVLSFQYHDELTRKAKYQAYFPKCQTIPLRAKSLFIPLLVMIGPAVMTAFSDAAGGESSLSTSSRLRRRPQICKSNISPHLGQKAHSHKQSLIIFTLTGMSMMQSSARQSLVTQCRNTVDIFWCLCLTKRKTSKEKRPI